MREYTSLRRNLTFPQASLLLLLHFAEVQQVKKRTHLVCLTEKEAKKLVRLLEIIYR